MQTTASRLDGRWSARMLLGPSRESMCSPGKTNGDDGGRSHPTLRVQGIREPVTEHSPSGPGPAFHGSDIAINVGPVLMVQVSTCFLRGEWVDSIGERSRRL